MKVNAKNAQSTSSHHQPRMDVMTNNALPTNDWMTVETAKIAKLVPIHLKTARLAKLNAMQTIRSSRRMGNAKHAHFTLSQTRTRKREVANQINAIQRTSTSS